MHGKLATARSLTARDWALLVEAWFALLGADFAVRLLPFRLLRRSLLAAPAPGEADPDGSKRVARLLDIAARNHVAHANCLRRALALRALLARRGHPALLRIGARPTDRGFVAHAWVEVDGLVVGDSDRAVATYRAFPLPAAEAVVLLRQAARDDER